jgi:hypothetical protein
MCGELGGTGGGVAKLTRHAKSPASAQLEYFENVFISERLLAVRVFNETRLGQRAAESRFMGVMDWGKKRVT